MNGSPSPDDLSLDERISRLEEAVSALVEKSQASKGRKMIVIGQVDVCSLDPTCDSALCESAGVYRHQKGCRGTACVQKNRAYYQDRRASATD